MTDPASRYANTQVRVLMTPNGSIPYLSRRLLPQPDTFTIVSETKVQVGERLDLISARTLGSPTLFWRLCDANNAMRPRDLEISGLTLRVPLPQP